MRAELRRIEEHLDASMKEALERSATVENEAMWALGLTAGIGILVGLVGSVWMVVFGVTKPLRKMVDQMRRVAAGDAQARSRSRTAPTRWPTWARRC